MALEMMTYNIRLTMFPSLVLLWGYRNSWSAWADRVFNLGIHLVSYPTSNTDKAESDLQTTIYSPFVASCILEEVSQSLSLPVSYSLPVSMGFRVHQPSMQCWLAPYSTDKLQCFQQIVWWMRESGHNPHAPLTVTKQGLVVQIIPLISVASSLCVNFNRLCVIPMRGSCRTALLSPT